MEKLWEEVERYRIRTISDGVNAPGIEGKGPQYLVPLSGKEGLTYLKQFL